MTVPTAMPVCGLTLETFTAREHPGAVGRESWAQFKSLRQRVGGRLAPSGRV
jgi:hypothetical protein